MRPYKIRLVFFCSLTLLFIALAVLTMGGIFSDIENAAYERIAARINPGLTLFMKVCTEAGSWYALIIIPSVLILIKQTRRKFGYPASVTLLISIALNNILKPVFRRPRPEIPTLISEWGFSFPSGHAQNSAAFFVALAVILFIGFRHRKTALFFIALCVLIPSIVAFTRVYLGVHYLGDVLAGLALGAAVAFGVSLAWDFLDQKTRGAQRFHRFFFDGI